MRQVIPCEKSAVDTRTEIASLSSDLQPTMRLCAKFWLVSTDLWVSVCNRHECLRFVRGNRFGHTMTLVRHMNIGFIHVKEMRPIVYTVANGHAHPTPSNHPHTNIHSLSFIHRSSSNTVCASLRTSSPSLFVRTGHINFRSIL
jgi:hypothetical protein